MVEARLGVTMEVLVAALEALVELEQKPETPLTTHYFKAVDAAYKQAREVLAQEKGEA